MEPPVPQLTKKELQEFAKDVRQGLSDEELKEKYDMSDRTLVLHKMAVLGRLRPVKPGAARPTGQINVDHMVEDIRGGMDEASLMQKYDLTSRELQKVFRKIISAGFMTARELADRLKITESQLTEVFALATGAIKDPRQPEGKE